MITVLHHGHIFEDSPKPTEIGINNRPKFASFG